MTPIDSIYVGNWIAIIENKYLDNACYHGSAFTGQPLKVKAISLPFICVDSNGETIAIDTRQFHFQKLNSKYVDEFFGKSKLKNKKPESKEEKKAPFDPWAASSAAVKSGAIPENWISDPSHELECPRCGDSMTLKEQSRNSVTAVCENCGFKVEGVILG